MGVYQPETMSKVFDRVMSRRDVATGEVKLQENKDYTSKGPLSIRNETNEVPEANVNVCYLLTTRETCSDEQIAALGNGSAVVEDWVVLEPKGSNGGYGPSNTGNDDQGEDNDGEDEEEVESRPSGADKNKALTASAIVAVMAVLLMDF